MCSFIITSRPQLILILTLFLVSVPFKWVMIWGIEININISKIQDQNILLAEKGVIMATSQDIIVFIFVVFRAGLYKLVSQQLKQFLMI